MSEGPDLASFARTLGEPSRIRMLTLLMGGRALTAKELAYGVGIDPATASGHLRRLEGERLITMAAQGRHRYFRIASPQVAELLESMMIVAAPLSGSTRIDAAMRRARFCYDHLAGELGTGLLDAMLARGLLEAEEGDYRVTRAGSVWLTGHGIDLEALSRGRRRLARSCLDWSERRDHLAGALGAALAERMLTLGWIERARRSRVVTVTALGRTALADQLGLVLPADAERDALAR